MISSMRPNKSTTLCVLCKRNISFFEQQSDDKTQHPMNGSFLNNTMLINRRIVRPVFLAAALALTLLVPSGLAHSQTIVNGNQDSDRLWVINTRHMSSNAACADLEAPDFRVVTIDICGNRSESTFDEYLVARADGRRTIVYVHGNRMDVNDAIARGLSVYQGVSRYRDAQPVDWVIFSWPSEKEGILAHDVRVKADRTDAQGLYLAWLLRRHHELGTPTSLIGYSFGGRVVTGSLHALAGGSLGGRALPGPATVGMNVDAGLVAPAIESNWMNHGGYHSLATQNLDDLVLLYNQRDAVLKRYWLIDRVRGQLALGYTGPQSFAPRFDGSQLSVKSRDCSSFVGLQHSEMDYYLPPCRAGLGLANLIDDVPVSF